MSKCTWRDKPGLDESCGLLASVGRTLCPRHEYLTRLRDEAAEEKYRKAILQKKVVTRMPTTRRELITYGYQFKGSGPCRDCEAHIEWWKTPNGNNAPYNRMDGDVEAAAVSHFATCPRAAAFRRSA